LVALTPHSEMGARKARLLRLDNLRLVVIVFVMRHPAVTTSGLAAGTSSVPGRTSREGGCFLTSEFMPSGAR
jgi:hypothetical protein